MDLRSVPAGDDPFTVLASEVGRLSRELGDLRSTALARAGGTSGFLAYRSTSQALSAATFTKIIFNVESFDEVDGYDPTTGVWTVASSGWRDVGGYLLFSTAAATERLAVAVYVNGTEAARLHDGAPGFAGSPSVGGTRPLRLTAGDEVAVYGYREAGGNVGGSAIYSVFTAKG